jgi:acid stress-induced BolA-like protein IbaG/YrbA
VLSAEQLKSYIVAGLACDYIQVLGDDGTHFEATIVAPAFEGKRMVVQHQMVYAALGERMRAEIHALGMKTYTPAQWTELNHQK